MRAAGRWAWWNQYGGVAVEKCVARAQGARLAGVIVKSGYGAVWRAFAGAGVPWATERYVYPEQPQTEAQRLAADIRAGARFAVVNAEVEWETLDGEPMRRLLAEFRRLQPDAEIYACVDTRGGRTALPYQRVLADHVTGWMPMVYPGAFGQRVSDAFAASLDGKPFGGKPVLPVIQAYNMIGPGVVREEIAEVRRRGLPGLSFYTIAHATDDEWAVVAQDQEVDDVDEEMRQLAKVAGLFQLAAAYALRGEPLPANIKAQLRYLLAA